MKKGIGEKVLGWFIIQEGDEASPPETPADGLRWLWQGRCSPVGCGVCSRGEGGIAPGKGD